MCGRNQRSCLSVCILLLLSIFLSRQAWADSPSVTAVLGNSEVEVGQTVRLQIRVTGGHNVDAPDQIAVDGLEISRTGTSQNFEMNNFTVTSSVTYEYTVLPLREGTFKIPPQTIRVAGKSLQTPELTLHVINSANSNARSGQARKAEPQRAAAGKLAFAELIVPKQSSFVGEMVPVQIRLGFEARSQPRLIDGPEITGQGFTAQKLQQSGERLETIDGRTYSVVTFKSAIAAARAGKLEIGPVKARAQIFVPRRSRPQQRGRSPFDIFDLNDPFSDPFFSDPFGQMRERREVQVQSEPVSFEVKPLPPNAPPQFSGAIGNFTMNTEAKPTNLQVGDPITVTSTITGRGNFDRANAPVLQDQQGWHEYPPSAKFNQDDDVGISGTKSFEMVISPNEKKKAIPPLVFAYFDPAKGDYVTLRSDPVPINVEGGSASVAAVQPASPAAPVPEQKPADILYQLNDFGRARSFTPLYMQPVFWAAQIVPLIGLLGFAGWRIRQNKIDNREARRIATLENEAAQLMRSLRRGDSSPQEYYADASRMVRIKTALAARDKAINPNVVDFEMAAATFQIDPDLHERLRQLFERSDELQYSGAPNGAENVSRENRKEILELIEHLK